MVRSSLMALKVSIPFTSEYSRFAVVHNGIVTNYDEIAGRLRARGVTFLSDTDSEVIAHLIDCYYTGDALSAVCRAARDLSGSFALGILCLEEEGVLYGVRKDSPLLVGKGNEENFICSDISGISEFCDEVAYPENNVVVRVTRESVEAFDLRGKTIPLPFSPNLQLGPHLIASRSAYSRLRKSMNFNGDSPFIASVNSKATTLGSGPLLLNGDCPHCG